MKMRLSNKKEFAFNAICPYYTMFPLEYPIRILRKHTHQTPVVLDPFCGRGTTIYAARKLGLTAYGLDISPIAAAIARAKLARASVDDVIELAERLLAKTPRAVPDTPFFNRGFSKSTLLQLCSLREGLLGETGWSNVAAILRAAALGCLHGPLVETHEVPSYFSNQMPRTFSSKPDYSVRFWREKGLRAPKASVIDVIRKKLSRIDDLDTNAHGSPRNVKCSDARLAGSYRNLPKASVTITSPPYYGMRTYVQDQWLRMWFLGGPAEVDYENNNQISHSGYDAFIKDLAKVWKHVRENSREDAHLYTRFGSIPSAKSDAKKLLRDSLEECGGWQLISVRNADSSAAGKRQADYMGRDSVPAEEYDFHAVVN